jgi:hypothetical protein
VGYIRTMTGVIRIMTAVIRVIRVMTGVIWVIRIIRVISGLYQDYDGGCVRAAFCEAVGIMF